MRRAGMIATLSATLMTGAVVAAAQPARLGQAAPEISGEAWINSAPLTMRALRGRVVLVEFWTYG